MQTGLQLCCSDATKKPGFCDKAHIMGVNILESPKAGCSTKYTQYIQVHQDLLYFTAPRSAVGNVSGYRCVSDCRSRGGEFDPGPVPYFRGD